MTKKTIITIITFAILTICIGTLIFLPFIQFDSTKNQIIDWISKGQETKLTGQKISDYKNGDNFNTIYADFYSRYEFVTTKFDIVKPLISVVKEDKATKFSSIDMYSLNRIGLNNFELLEIRTSSLKNKTFQEAVEIARKYDLTKENPDPANIVVYPAPTREEVAKSKTRDTKDEELRNNPAFQPDLDKCISYIAKTVEEQKVQVQCLKDINTKYNTTYDIPKI